MLRKISWCHSWCHAQRACNRAASLPKQERTAMASNRRKRKRIRSPHPGVYVIGRTLSSGAVAYRARYADPDSRRTVWITLDLVALPTREARALWAKRKSQELAKRRMDLAAGA